MNAQTPVKAKAKEPDNLRIWNTLAKTDPKHTKSFSRAGGFKGTAIKPIWQIKMLTELFGPCGEGWGIGKPEFQVETMLGGETLVYCTVACWHTSPENVLFGVGGDKVVSARRDGNTFCDDEAFKKAFTDAVGNAFKFIGVGADVHMGQFDDSKYVAEVAKEFSAGESKPEKRQPLAGPYTSKTALWAAVKAFVHACNGFSANDELLPYLQTEDVVALLEQCKRDAIGLWSEGLPELPEYEPLESFIHRKQREFEEVESIANSPAAKMVRAG